MSDAKRSVPVPGGVCPLPIESHATVQLAHGGGGRLMGQLIERVFLGAFGGPAAGERHDAAVLDAGSGRIALTTDGYVVRPLVFPGGDVGSLAVHGTVNDLAMSGARAAWLSAGFILEEGLPMEMLRRIVRSMAGAAADCGVAIVTGDTKVVDKGKGDGVFITTTGVGRVGHDRLLAPAGVRPGDAVIVSGDLGRHGMAVMAVREGLEFESAIESDSASVAGPALALLDEGLDVHCLRDLTRGGLTAALNEIAVAAGLEIEIGEAAVPVRGDVAAACEILGLDPLGVACEGRFVAFVPAAEADRALAVMRRFAVSAGAAPVGTVGDRAAGRVILTSRIGTRRILDLPAGEQLPRIC